MPNIKPVSDLRNYNDVLRDVTKDEPVFLTKNGRGRYVLLDMQDYEKTQAALKLMQKLAEAQATADAQGWLSAQDVRRELGL